MKLRFSVTNTDLATTLAGPTFQNPILSPCFTAIDLVSINYNRNRMLSCHITIIYSKEHRRVNVLCVGDRLSVKHREFKSTEMTS